MNNDNNKFLDIYIYKYDDINNDFYRDMYKRAHVWPNGYKY